MDKIRILWAVHCSYSGSETLRDLSEFFEGEKLKTQFIGVYDGAKAAKKIHDQQFDLIILDQNLQYVSIAEAYLEKTFLGNSFIIRLLKNGEFKFEGVDRRCLRVIDGLESSFHDIKEILKKIF